MSSPYTTPARVLAALLWPTLVSGCTYDFDALMPASSAEPASLGDAGLDGDAALGDAAVGPTGEISGCTEPMAKVLEGHCYFPLPTSSDWDGARSSCAAVGAHLVTITSAAEEQLVQSIRSGRDRWIGLRRADGAPAASSSFSWVTAESSSYSKWASGEPNGSGACARLRAYGDWADMSCTSVYDAICERE